MIASGAMRCSPASGHSNQQAARGRVLLAEDDEDLRTLLADLLRAAGLEVIEAADGHAFQRLVAAAPAGSDGASLADVIVTDVRMPGPSGLDVVAALRSAGHEVPVVVITGYGDAMARAAAKRLNVAAVLDKPFDLATLRATVLGLARR